MSNSSSHCSNTSVDPLIHSIFTYISESQFWTIPIILLFWNLGLHELSLCAQYDSEVHLFSRTISIQSVNFNRASMEYTQNSDFCSLQSDILSIKSDRAEMNETFEKVKVILLTMMGLLRKWKWASYICISGLTTWFIMMLEFIHYNEEKDDNWLSFKGFIIKLSCVTSVFSNTDPVVSRCVHS